MSGGWQSWLAVGVGSGLGGVGRYGVGLLSRRALTFAAPWPGLVGTLTVNLVGSALLAWLLARQQGAAPDALRLAVTTGFMGGFTTYSTFNTEVVALLHAGHGREAVGYMLTTVAVCLLGGWLGYALGATSTG